MLPTCDASQVSLQEQEYPGAMASLQSKESFLP
jgi:hypothetical protein